MSSYHYTSVTSLAKTALCDWTFESWSDCSSKVVPDGCRDLIWMETHNQGSSWFVSDLSESAYFVDFQANERAYGIRLRPGTTIDETALSNCLQAHPVSELAGNDWLDEFCIRSSELTDALLCLESGLPSVQSAATELGVSLRTLQRLIKKETNKSPQFWHSLSKARRAGRSLQTYQHLSEAAYCLGYSDQAHLTREMGRWFGETPKQLKENHALIELLSEPGFG